MEYIERISGEVEAVGQSQFNLGGTFYSYIRILDDAGNVRMIKNVGIPNTVNSYISPGSKGVLYFAKINKKTSIVFAYSNNERKVYDSDDMKSIIKALKLQGIWWVIMLPFALISILLMGIGLILTPACLYFAYVHLSKIPGRISDSKLRGYLSQHGFA